MKRIIALLALAGALAAAIATELPQIRRYMKMRSM
jgi:hypothetical protein